MNSGESLQSYSHQLVVTKSEKQMMQLDSDSDNIDVGNDNDKDLGNYSFFTFVKILKWKSEWL